MRAWLVFSYLQLWSRIGVRAKWLPSNRKKQIALHHKPFMISTH